jgi:CheY-like chemotaxis protein
MHFHLPLSEAPEQFRSAKEKGISMEILRDKTVLLVDSKSSRRIQLLEQLVKLRMKPLACATYEEGLAYWHMSPTDLVIMEMSQPLSSSSPPSPPLSSPSQSLPSPSQSLPPPPSLPLINEIHDQQIPILSLSEFTNIHDLSQQILSMLRPSSTSTVTVQKRQQIFPMDILIVEDNPHNMTVICETLKKIGYVEKNIDKAVNGAEAIQKAVSKQHDIILMDLLLPTVDGLSAGAQILTFYRNKCPKHIRYAIDKYESLTPTIVALTAMVTSETQTRCKQAGFKGFLSKPINREELETMLAIISKRRQQSRKNLSQGDK